MHPKAGLIRWVIVHVVILVFTRARACQNVCILMVTCIPMATLNFDIIEKALVLIVIVYRSA